MMGIKTFACECFYSPFEESLKESNNIFSARVISQQKNHRTRFDKYSFLAIKNRVVVQIQWKGQLNTDTIDVFTGSGGPDCGFEFEINKTYLIWATTSDEYLFTIRCERTRLLNNSPDIDLLNYLFKGATYDSIYLMPNELAFLHQKTKTDSINLIKVSLFVMDNKLLSKKELINKLTYNILI